MSAPTADAEKQQAAPADGESQAPKAGPKAPVMIAVMVAAAAAGIGGGLVLAPRLVPHQGAPADSAEAGGAGEHGSESKAGGGRIFKLDNLIVNPAGSEGSRFLMTSVAFEVESEAAERALKEHDVQLRDLVVSRLESQTMQMLTRPFARDSVKRELATAVADIIGRDAAVRVYLPQFVIQ